MYLIEIHYDDEAERRRIEYLIKKYKGGVEKLNGIALYVKDDGIIEDFLIEMRSKLIEENISVYKLEEAEVSADPERVDLRMEFSQKPHTVNAFLGYFIEKRQGELMKQLPGYHRWYRILTRKGKVDLEVEVKGDTDTRLRVVIEGYEPALSIVRNELEKDLHHFKAGGTS